MSRSIENNQSIICANNLKDQYEELDEIEVNCDDFQEILGEQINDPHKHLLIQQIDQWERDSIKKIQQTANEYRHRLFEHIIRHINQIEINLNKLNDQIKDSHQEKNFKEINLEKLKKLSDQLDKIPNVSIENSSESLINKNSIIVPSRKYIFISQNIFIFFSFFFLKNYSLL